MPETPFSRSHASSVALCLFSAYLGFTIPAQGAANPAPSVAVVASTPKAAPQTQEAKAALSKAVAFQREAKDLVLKFRASVYNSALDKHEDYNGKLLLKDANRFRLEIPGGIYVCDGVTFWEYHPQNRQVVIRKADDLEDKPLPGDILLRFLNSDPLSIVKTKADGKEYLELQLDPSRAMKSLDSLSVLLNPSDFSLHRISSRDVSGNEAQYTVTSVKRNGGIKDKEFTFEPPKGVDLVDMRD